MVMVRLDHVSQVLPMPTVHIRGWGFGHLPGVTFPTPPLGLEVLCHPQWLMSLRCGSNGQDRLAPAYKAHKVV